MMPEGIFILNFLLFIFENNSNKVIMGNILRYEILNNNYVYLVIRINIKL